MIYVYGIIIIFFASLNKSTSQFVLIDANKYSIEKRFEVNEENPPKGNGIKILKHEIYGSYLLSSSLNGLLNLYC